MVPYEKNILIGVARIDVRGLFSQDCIFGEYPTLNGIYHIMHEGREGSQG